MLEILWRITVQQYGILSKDEDYKSDWELCREYRDKLHKSINTADRLKYSFLLAELRMEIQRKWYLITPISPYLKIKLDDWRKSVRPNSTLAKIIEAFGLTIDYQPLTSYKHKKTVSKDRLEMEMAFKKFQCYSMFKKGKTFREIGRHLKISKDTAQSWSEEVKSWSKDYKEKIVANFVSSKSIPDNDAYDTGESEDYEGEKRISAYRPKTLQPVDKIAHVLTNEGLYKSGRKKQHKPSDKEQED